MKNNTSTKKQIEAFMKKDVKTFGERIKFQIALKEKDERTERK